MKLENYVPSIEFFKTMNKYGKETESLYHSSMYSLVSLLSGIYPFNSMHCIHSLSQLCYKILIGINQGLIKWQEILPDTGVNVTVVAVEDRAH